MTASVSVSTRACSTVFTDYTETGNSLISSIQRTRVKEVFQARLLRAGLIRREFLQRFHGIVSYAGDQRIYCVPNAFNSTRWLNELHKFCPLGYWGWWWPMIDSHSWSLKYLKPFPSFQWSEWGNYHNFWSIHNFGRFFALNIHVLQQISSNEIYRLFPLWVEAYESVFFCSMSFRSRI